mgnify:CR=1 FL=1
MPEVFTAEAWDGFWEKPWNPGTAVFCSGRKKDPRIWSGNWTGRDGDTGMCLFTGSVPGKS